MESALVIPLLRREGAVLSLTLEAQKRVKLLMRRRISVALCLPLAAAQSFDRPFAFPRLSGFGRRQDRKHTCCRKRAGRGTAATDASAFRT